MAAVAGNFSLGELLNATAAGQNHLYHLLLTSKGAEARTMRKISEPRPWPQSRPRKRYGLRGVDLSAAIGTDPPLKGAGETFRPRQEAANIFSAAAHGGRAAGPRYAPPLDPKLQ